MHNIGQNWTLLYIKGAFIIDAADKFDLKSNLLDFELLRKDPFLLVDGLGDSRWLVTGDTPAGEADPELLLLDTLSRSMSLANLVLW